MEEFNVKEKYEDLNLIQRISSAYVALDDDFNPFEERIMRNQFIAAGRIFNEADYAKLKKQRRPHFQVNLHNPNLRKLIGSFKGNLPGLEFHGRSGMEDEKSSELMKNINDFILFTQNDITFELADAYKHTLISRIGWLKQDYNFIKDEEGGVNISAYKKLLRFDTSVTTRDFSDCQFIADGGWLSTEELINIYGRNNPELAGLIEQNSRDLIGESDTYKNKLKTWFERIGKFFDNSDNDNYNLARWFNKKSGRFFVLDWYERRQEKRVQMYTEQGLMDISKLDRNAVVRLRESMPNAIILEDYFSKIYQVSICRALNLKLFDGPQKLQNGNFKFTPILCYWDHPDILETRSLIDVTKDSVKKYNFHSNTNLTYLMRSTHGGYLVEEGENTQQIVEKLKDNEIAGVKIVPRGTISGNRIMEQKIPSIDQALIVEKQTAYDETEKLAGIPPISKGISESASESGKHAQIKSSEADIMQEDVNENAQHALVQISQNDLWYIQNYYTQERVIRITNDEGMPQWIMINQRVLGKVLNDVTIGKYDIVISSKPFGRYAKANYYQELIEMLGIALKLGPQYALVCAQIFKELVKLKNVPSKEDIFAAIELGTGITRQQIEQQLLLSQSNTEMQLTNNQAAEQQIAGQQVFNQYS